MATQILAVAHDLVKRLPSIEYGEEKLHQWGPVTATLNWCEEDYYLTQYCAEIVNSTTNAIFVYLAVRGMRNCYKEGHDWIFFITFFGYLCVGLGSFLFHSTLWYSMQLVDELSMIYTTCLMFWATFAHSRSIKFATILAFLLGLLAATISAIYHYLQDPKFHQNAYAILTAIVLFRSWYMMERHVREIDPVAVKRMWKMVSWGLSVFLTGFLIWNLDNVYCNSLRRWRKEVGLPWGILAEGHGWWHLMTGVGAYYELQYGIYLRHCLDGKQGKYELVWPSIWHLPVINRRKGEGRGLNGGAKGGMNGAYVNGNGVAKKEQ